MKPMRWLFTCLSLLLASCGMILGEGKVFVWNGTERPVIVTVSGRTKAELPLRPGTGHLIEGAVAGDYVFTIQSDDGSEMKVTAKVAVDRLFLLSVGGASCFVRADIAGMYQSGKPRVQVITSYEPAETYDLDDILHVYPGELPPSERPRSAFSFQRLYDVPCKLTKSEGDLLEHLRTMR
jgi:hypothetical protein